jgi:ADP-ribose pyrophosphatase YjhB (NUDIX family)
VTEQQHGPQVAVGAIVVANGAMLMVQRGQGLATGLWSVPGGRVEAGEYLIDALKREVREETGIDIEVGELAGIFEVIGDRHYVILDYLATTSVAADPVPGTDAADARWVPLEEIPSLDCTPRFVETMRAWGVLPDESSADE